MTVLTPEKITVLRTTNFSELGWQTILYNCNCHTFETVIEQLMKAIGCSYATASQLANVADQLGSVSVYKGTYEQCENVADILGSVGLEVKVSQ
jgi:hypothetical protein